MKAWFPLLLTCGVFASARAWAHIDEPDIAADCQKVASYAELGKRPISGRITPKPPTSFAIRRPGASFAA
ncbi:hypothetical protein AK51_12720 [Serratia nematodiphila DZ0503SBS1]|nr:hypothetical protein AK51_12720 [Serratia nematodiphila DZ0503SBS1]